MSDKITLVVGKVVGVGEDFTNDSRIASRTFIDIEDCNGEITRINKVILPTSILGMIIQSTSNSNSQTEIVELHIFGVSGRNFCLAARCGDDYYFNYSEFELLQKQFSMSIFVNLQYLLLAILCSIIVIGIPFVFYFSYRALMSITYSMDIRSKCIEEHLTNYGFTIPKKYTPSITREM